MSEILESEIVSDNLVHEMNEFYSVEVDIESFLTLVLWLDSDSGSMCCWALQMLLFY